MTANDDSPRRGKDPAKGIEQTKAFADVGRELLSFELETTADNLSREFRKASTKVRNADRITEADARRLADAVERADVFVDSFYDACQEAERPPHLEDLATIDELKEITSRNTEAENDA